MRDVNTILYPCGCYGNFINYITLYLAGKIDIEFPKLNDRKVFHMLYENKMKYTFYAYERQSLISWVNNTPNCYNQDSKQEYVNLLMHEHACFPTNDHTWLFDHSIIEAWIRALTFCSLNFKRTLFIYNTRDCYAWRLNNEYFKIKQYEDWKKHGISEEWGDAWYDDADLGEYKECEKITGIDRARCQLNVDIPKENLQQYNVESVYDLNPGQLRHLMSQYLYDKTIRDHLTNQEIEVLKDEYPNVCFVDISDFRGNFVSTLKRICKYFNIKTKKKDEELYEIKEYWSKLQDHMYKDILIENIIFSLKKDYPFDWSRGPKLTFIDEFILQRYLNDIGINFSMWNDDPFPVNTEQLKNYIT